MKNRKLFLMTLILVVCSVFVSFGQLSAHAEENEVEDKFAEHFFPSGKIENVPQNAYVSVDYYNDYGSLGTVWIQNTSEFIDLFVEYDDYSAKDQRQKFMDKYNLFDFDTWMIADLKVDDGKWISDFATIDGREFRVDGELKGNGLPDYYLFNNNDHRVDGVNMYSGTLFDCNAHDADNKDDDGILAGTIIEEKDGYKKVLDADNHTFSFRFRFCVAYTNRDPKTDTYSGARYLYSDWSKAVSIGKNGKQKPLKTPTSLTAPEISEPVKKLNNDSVWGGDLYYQILFPEDATNEERALIINEDAFQPLYLQVEAEVNDRGEFIELYTANPNSLGNGTRATGITVDDFGGASKVKHVLLRGYDRCSQLGIQSAYAYAVPQVKGVKAKKTTTTSITLTWTKLKNVDFYEIYDGNGKFLGKTSKNTNTFTVKKLKAGNDYTFKVRAVDNEIFVGLFSAAAKLPTKPSKVSLTKLSSPSAKKLTATWKKVSGDGYQIQIATDKSFKKIVKEDSIGKADQLSYTYAKGKSKTKYYVRVRGVNKAGKSTVYGAWSTVKYAKCK